LDLFIHNNIWHHIGQHIELLWVDTLKGRYINIQLPYIALIVKALILLLLLNVYSKPELLRGVYCMGFYSPSKIQETALPALLANPCVFGLYSLETFSQVRACIGLV